MKSKSTIFLIIILGIIIISIISAVSQYNSIATGEQAVKASWGNVQSAYQRRADLIPNLVKTVKGSAEFEKKVLTEVTQARAGIVGAKTPQDLELMGRKINTAINLAYEAYPQLKSTQLFGDLQAQLEGTENRINTERNRYNETVKGFNSKIVTFPNNLVAKMFGFSEKTFFESKAGAENAPTVEF